VNWTSVLLLAGYPTPRRDDHRGDMARVCLCVCVWLHRVSYTGCQVRSCVRVACIDPSWTCVTSTIETYYLNLIYAKQPNRYKDSILACGWVGGWVERGGGLLSLNSQSSSIMSYVSKEY